MREKTERMNKMTRVKEPQACRPAIRQRTAWSHRIPAIFFICAVVITCHPVHGTEASDSTTRGALVVKTTAGNQDELARVQVVDGLSVHKETFILPFTTSNLYYGGQSEIEFQISFKQQILHLPFYFAYTQKSFWQAYNAANSSPFRETNYNPEIFYRFAPGALPLKSLGLDAGAEHESNGQSGTLSRSWNRVYLAPYLPQGKSLWYWKFWLRIPEPASTDDNPDITDYTGWSELHYRHRFNNGQFIHIMLRGNPATGKGAVSLNYSFAGSPDSYHYVLHLFSGYDESLIDYNRKNTRIGFGVIFVR
jgi:phospholipase A1